MVLEAKPRAKKRYSRPDAARNAFTFILGVYHCGLPRDDDRRPDPLELSIFTP